MQGFYFPFYNLCLFYWLLLVSLLLQHFFTDVKEFKLYTRAVTKLYVEITTTSSELMAFNDFFFEKQLCVWVREWGCDVMHF